MIEGVAEQPWHEEVHATCEEEDDGRGVWRDDAMRDEDAIP